MIIFTNLLACFYIDKANLPTECSHCIPIQDSFEINPVYLVYTVYIR